MDWTEFETRSNYQQGMDWTEFETRSNYFHFELYRLVDADGELLVAGTGTLFVVQLFFSSSTPKRMADTDTAKLCVAECKLCAGLCATPLSAGLVTYGSFQNDFRTHRQAVTTAWKLTARIADAVRTPPVEEEPPLLEPLFREAAADGHPPARPHLYHNYWPYLRLTYPQLLRGLNCTDHELLCWQRYDGFLWGSLQGDWERFAHHYGEAATAGQCPPVEYVLSRRLLRFWTVGLAVCLCQWAAGSQQQRQRGASRAVFDSDDGGTRKRARPDGSHPLPLLGGGLTPDTIDRLLQMGFPGSLVAARIPADHAAAAADPVGRAAADDDAADVAAPAGTPFISSNGLQWWKVSIAHLDELVTRGTVLPSMMCWTDGGSLPQLGNPIATGRTWSSLLRGWTAILKRASSPCSEDRPRRNEASLEMIANAIDNRSCWDAAESISGTAAERGAFVQAWQDGVRTLSHLCQRALVTIRLKLVGRLPPLVQAVQQHHVLSLACKDVSVHLAWWTGRYAVRRMESLPELEVTLGPFLAAAKECRVSLVYLKRLLEEWRIHCPEDSEHFVLQGTLRQEGTLTRSGSYACVGSCFTYTTRDGVAPDDGGWCDSSTTRDKVAAELIAVCGFSRSQLSAGVQVVAATVFSSCQHLPPGMSFLDSPRAVAMHLCISGKPCADGRYRLRGIYVDESQLVWSADGYLHGTSLVVRVAADWKTWTTRLCNSVLSGDWQPSPPPLSVAALNTITTDDRCALIADLALSGLHELPSRASAAIARWHSVNDMCAAVFLSGTTIASVRQALEQSSPSWEGAAHADFVQLKEPFHELSRLMAATVSVSSFASISALRWVACHCDALLKCYVRAAVTASALDQLSCRNPQLFCRLSKARPPDCASGAPAVFKLVTTLRLCQDALGVVQAGQHLSNLSAGAASTGAADEADAADLDEAAALNALKAWKDDWASMLSSSEVNDLIHRAGMRLAVKAHGAIARLLTVAATVTGLAERAYLHAASSLRTHKTSPELMMTTWELFRTQCTNSVLLPLLTLPNRLGQWTHFTASLYAAVSDKDFLQLDSLLSAADTLELLRANSRRGEPVVPSAAAFAGVSVGATAKVRVTQTKKIVACRRFTVAPTVADAVLLHRVLSHRSGPPVAPSSASAADNACLRVIAQYVSVCTAYILRHTAACALAQTATR
jgi:hypothetical protein